MRPTRMHPVECRQPATAPTGNLATGYGGVILAIIGLKNDSIAVWRMDVKHDTV